MSSKTFAILVQELCVALDAFEFGLASEVTSKLIALSLRREKPAPVKHITRAMNALRGKRRFNDLGRFADAMLASGANHPFIRKHYAQALIEQQQVFAGLALATQLAKDQKKGKEWTEAEGLIGRVHKQLYVRKKTATSLHAALEAYSRPWQRNPSDNLWHGINLVALLDRGRRDRHSLEQYETSASIASSVLSVIKKNRKDAGVVPHWDLATAMEACVALERHDEAFKWAKRYVKDKQTSAFELGSTLRQLKEVWQLNEQLEPGRTLLPMLQAELLNHEGGAVQIPTKDLQSGKTGPDDKTHLQKVFGTDRYETWLWYQKGLTRCQLVARLQTTDGRGFGSGVLVDGSRFGHPGERLLLTNSHVISQDGDGHSLRPEEAVACFEAKQNDVSKIVQVLASSPVNELDYSLLRLENDVTQDGTPLGTFLNPKGESDARLYAIGYPHGATLSVSIHDNQFIEHNETRIHYRTPTDPGSSGCPIFDKNWKLVALHRAGHEKLRRLKGDGFHAANEGILVDAIIHHASGSKPYRNIQPKSPNDRTANRYKTDTGIDADFVSADVDSELIDRSAADPVASETVTGAVSISIGNARVSVPISVKLSQPSPSAIDATEG